MNDNKVNIHTIEMELNTFSKKQNLHYIDYMFNNYKDIDGVFATDLVSFAKTPKEIIITLRNIIILFLCFI